MASNIALLYIPGINEVDTPVFDTLSAQTVFMNDALVSTPLDGFYVPHYKDMLEVSLEDLVFNNEYIKVNYLLIEYLNKKYYYFIDAIEYVSESVARIFIRLDSIQTYMFDIDFIQSHLTRSSIKRWASDTLYNRDYLRENFSAGNFRLKRKRYFRRKSDFTSHVYEVDDIETGTLLIKFPPDTPPTWYFGIKYGTEVITSSYEYVFSPIVNGKPTDSISWYYSTGQSWETHVPIEQCNKFSRQHDETLLYYYLPFSPFKTKTVYNQSENKNIITLPPAVDYEGVNDLFTLTQFNIADLVEYYHRESLGYLRPTAGADFDIRYIPALMDDFYRKYQFGEQGTKASIPLQLVDGQEITFRYIGDPFSGKRLYYSTASHTIVTASNAQDNPHGIVDTLGTLACANNPITLDLSTDAYIKYYSYNKASTWAGVATTVADLFKFIGGML